MAHLSHSADVRFSKADPKWLPIGAKVNELVNKWAKRSDIVTFAAPNAGHGAPACFVPAIAEMEIDVTLCFGAEAEPSFVGDLTKRSVQFDWPVAMGAILHEAMHAKHSTYDLAEVAKLEDRFISGLITWFEETRIEARGVKAYPENRAFLRACALKLVIGDLKETEDFAGRGIQAFSQLILLTLARVDAGVLDKSDVKIIQDAMDKMFDKPTRKKLRSIWVRAQKHSLDNDWRPQEKLAREWVEVLKESGNDPEQENGGDVPEWLKELMEEMMGEGDGDGGEGQEGDQQGEGSGSGKGLLEKMAEQTAEDAQQDANDQATKEVREQIAKEKEARGKESTSHKETAGKVFGRGTGPAGHSTSSHLVDERMPTSQERAAAVALSKALERARYRDRVVTRRTSVIPPGRLSARRALAAEEQRSRDAVVTAEPWSAKKRKHVEDPTLKVGVLVDISGSMHAAMEPMASTAWILSEAVRRIQGKVAMVYYGNDAFPVLKPGQHLDKVRVYSASDGTERFDKAFQALDGSLNLLNDTGARLLVIVSDLYYTGHEGERTRYWMKRCREEGIAVIIVPFHYEVQAADVVKRSGAKGVEMIPNSKASGNITGAARAIGEAAVRQLTALSS